MRDPHQNIFYYYRGPSKNRDSSRYDIQLEDNATKSLINILELSYETGFNALLNSIIESIKFSKASVITFELQKGLGYSRPDALIDFADRALYIESKVMAKLDKKQIKQHLKTLTAKDALLVITNRQQDATKLISIGDKRIRYLRWADIHRMCKKIIANIKADKTNALMEKIFKQFVDYLEVIVMTDFTGITDADFDFWIDLNPNYKPILKKKLEALATVIKEKLPGEMRGEYSDIKPGYISRNTRDERYAWVAIKRSEEAGGRFNQCNFTIEISKNSLDINAVIRNGRICNEEKPIGVFYKKLYNDKEGFLKAIKHIRKNARIVISKRFKRARTEWWRWFFDMKLCDIVDDDDIDYLYGVLEKAEHGPIPPEIPPDAGIFPGVHIRFSIDRGDKVLSNPAELEKIIISTIFEFKPVLDYLEG